MLLNLNFSKEVFADYWEIKFELFRVAGVKYSFKKSLSDFNIKRHDIQPLADYVGKGVWKVLDPWIKKKEADLKNYRFSSRTGSQKSRIIAERNRTLFMVSSTCAAPILFRMVQFYMAENVVQNGLDQNSEVSEHDIESVDDDMIYEEMNSENQDNYGEQDEE